MPAHPFMHAASFGKHATGLRSPCRWTTAVNTISSGAPTATAATSESSTSENVRIALSSLQLIQVLRPFDPVLIKACAPAAPNAVLSLTVFQGETAGAAQFFPRSKLLFFNPFGS